MEITFNDLIDGQAAYSEALSKVKNKGEKVELPLGAYKCTATSSKLKRFQNGDVLFIDFVVTGSEYGVDIEQSGVEFSIGYNLTNSKTMFKFVNAYHVISAESTKDRLSAAAAEFTQEIIGRNCVVSIEESEGKNGTIYRNEVLKSVEPRTQLTGAPF